MLVMPDLFYVHLVINPLGRLDQVSSALGDSVYQHQVTRLLFEHANIF